MFCECSKIKTQCDGRLCILVKGITYITTDNCYSCTKLDTCDYLIENCKRDEKDLPKLQRYDTCPNPQYDTCAGF